MYKQKELKVEHGKVEVMWHKSCMGMQEECQDLSGSL